MTKAKNLAYRLRLLILIFGVGLTLCGLTWAILPFLNDTFDIDMFGLMGTVLAPSPIVGDSELAYGINLIFVLGLFLLLQWAFLRPCKGWTLRLAGEGRPLKSALIAAAVIAMLLTTGFIALILELANWWQPVMESESLWVLSSIWAVMLLIWGFWIIVFFRYWKQGDRYTQMGKMIRGLVAGSLMEILVAVPVHVWATRQRECYCCRGTYTTLVLAATVLIWVFGPGIVMLYYREKYRRMNLVSDESDVTLRQSTGSQELDDDDGAEIGQAGVGE